ncbi:MAG: rhodanese-like domain-containing protein [Dehalococcoidales bacterium]
MKIQRLIPALLLFFALNSVFMVGCNKTASQNISTPTTTITASEANKLIAENIGNKNFVILDVRTSDEYISRHIVGAIDISYESTNFRADIGKLDKNKQYLIYCANGVNGAVATQIMLGLGFKHIQNITGGYAAWVQEGFITCGCPGTVIN